MRKLEKSWMPSAIALSCGALIATSLPATGETTVIYTEIATSATSDVPGALNGDGSPANTKWLAIEDLNIRQDGGQWGLKGRTLQPTTNDSIVLLGSGTVGTMFLQDGQPVQGGAAGELWDFFDSPNPVTWDDAGNIGFSARAKNGVPNTLEKLVRVVGATHTVLLKQGDPAVGLSDVVANPTGDEAFGNSMGSVQLLNNGTLFLVNTPIANCHSSRYPAAFFTQNAFRQSGVSPVGGFETWDSFVLDGAGVTPDGAHWFAEGDTENPSTTIDGIFVVDDVVVMRENTQLGTTGIIAVDVFFTRMTPNGNWFTRGDDTADNDWAIRNDPEGPAGSFVLLAKTGDPITSGSRELWGDTFSALHGDSAGNWVLAGNTTNGDPLTDSVIVRNGKEVILRENDPVDVNGNGEFDDDAFIGNNNVGSNISGFQPNDLFIADDGSIYVLVVLRNSANTVLGDAFLFIPPDTIPCLGDIAPDGGNGEVDVDDLLAVINSWGPCEGCPADLTGNGEVDVDDLLTVINAWGPCS